MTKAKKNNFITLKEAGEISGYSPDYLGQLIRGGKLEGQQVFMNVAWMTTKEAVEEYINKSKNKKVQNEETTKEKIAGFWKNNWRNVYRFFLYTIIIVNIFFIFFLLHLSSFSIEKHLEQKDLQKQESSLSRNNSN